MDRQQLHDRLDQLVELGLIKLVRYIDERNPNHLLRRIVTPSGIWLRHADIEALAGCKRKDIRLWVDLRDATVGISTTQQHFDAIANEEQHERLKVLFTAPVVEEPEEAPYISFMGVSLSHAELRRLEALYQ
ncbi:hypothetical protein AB4304_13960 [Vibrio breoganii]